jgi:hypothetical protein
MQYSAVQLGAMAGRRKRGPLLENPHLFTIETRGRQEADKKQTRSKGKRDERLLGPKHEAGMRANRAAGEGEELG